MKNNSRLNTDITIGLVGPCAAGKTTLSKLLKEKGYSNVRQIAQEHSYVPDMWKIVSNPDVLVYLDVSFENSMRRKKQNWNYRDYQIQLGRLNNALNNADLYIDTNNLSVEQVFEKVIKYLRNKQILG